MTPDRNNATHSAIGRCVRGIESTVRLVHQGRFELAEEWAERALREFMLAMDFADDPALSTGGEGE